MVNSENLSILATIYRLAILIPSIAVGVRRIYRIIDGIHRANALYELGYKTIIAFVGIE